MAGKVFTALLVTLFFIFWLAVTAVGFGAVTVFIEGVW